MQRTLRGVAAATALVFALAGLMSAQSGSATPPEQQPPVFRTEANYVRVDVYPTSNGKPVLDLKAEDFQVFEDGTPQTIQSFEHVVVRPAGPQAGRIEPNTIEEARQLAANPRNRVFVLFLDVPHVTIHGGWTIREPLIRLMDRILGDDDLIGIMTPAMSAADLVLARKTEVMAGGLRDRWPWGERHSLAKSEYELMYESCYPWEATRGVVDEMIHRRRERATLQALDELVHYLGNVREDRKAILTITEGWRLYRPNTDLTRLRVIDPQTGATEPVPGGPGIGVGPDGRLRVEGDGHNSNIDRSDCDRDRGHLSLIDNDRYLRDLMDSANRWNASFYTVDPRGLAVWDAPLGPASPPPPQVDYQNLRTRHDAMIALATNTDGIAVMNSNDLDKGLKRIADDLTSYYLLGYYSTNGKFDGTFRSIKVDVTRPGVDVRARRGYRAATEDEVIAAKAAAAAPVPEPVATVTAAMTELSRIRSDAHLAINAVVHPGGAGGAAVLWIAGELRNFPQQAGDGASEILVDLQVSGGASGSAQVPLASGQRSFLTSIVLEGAGAGGLDIRGRLSGVSSVPYTDSIRIEAGSAGALLYRRGPSTGNRPQPAGSFQFRRTERVRLEFPLPAGASPGSGRILDRNAQPLAVPVTVGERTDSQTGQRWLTADIVLAPLTLGDYAVEVGVKRESREERLVTAIRVGR